MIRRVNLDQIKMPEFAEYPELDDVFNGTIQRCLSGDRIIEINPDPIAGFFSLTIYHLGSEFTYFKTKEPVPRGLVEKYLEQELRCSLEDVALFDWRTCEQASDTRKPPSSLVYFIKVGQFVKIGTTTNLSSRINSFQIGCPYEFTILATIPGGRREEQGFHRKFSHLSHTGEWFRMEGELAAFLAEVTK